MNNLNHFITIILQELKNQDSSNNYLLESWDEYYWIIYYSIFCYIHIYFLMYFYINKIDDNGERFECVVILSSTFWNSFVWSKILLSIDKLNTHLLLSSNHKYFLIF